VEHEREQADISRQAVTFARARNLEREAVVEEQAILRDAFQRSLAEARFDNIKQEVDRPVERGDFVAVQPEQSTPGRSFTTPSMMELELETIDRMHTGRAQHAELVSNITRATVAPSVDADSRPAKSTPVPSPEAGRPGGTSAFAETIDKMRLYRQGSERC
jgi:hypothetical protein